ncbi:MAG: hypothetical protein ACKO0Z_01855 [Betaproteobacteria bacterium]
MNAHTKLKFHLERHVYKRGKYKGDAPADQSRRAKRHFRVVKGNGGQMIVRMHNTDIITAYEDGHIRLYTCGWHNAPTTRACMNEALSRFFGFVYMRSVRKFGISTTGICSNNETYRYYDGMEFSADGTLMTPPIVFHKEVADRDERAELRQAAIESGFVGMFPVLFNAATADGTSRHVPNQMILNAIRSESYAAQWPAIAAHIKYPTYWAMYKHISPYDNHKEALSALMRRLTKDMTITVPSNVTVL